MATYYARAVVDGTTTPQIISVRARSQARLDDSNGRIHTADSLQGGKHDQANTHGW